MLILLVTYVLKLKMLCCNFYISLTGSFVRFGFQDLHIASFPRHTKKTGIPPGPTISLLHVDCNNIVYLPMRESSRKLSLDGSFSFSFFFIFLFLFNVHTMRNKTRVQTAKPHTRKKNIRTHSATGSGGGGEDKMNKSQSEIFDYFFESTDEVSERFSADLLLRTNVNNKFYRPFGNTYITFILVYFALYAIFSSSSHLTSRVPLASATAAVPLSRAPSVL